jgi:hypothetical protein
MTMNNIKYLGNIHVELIEMQVGKCVLENKTIHSESNHGCM